jgi:hypothetical protein
MDQMTTLNESDPPRNPITPGDEATGGLSTEPDEDLLGLSLAELVLILDLIEQTDSGGPQ